MVAKIVDKSVKKAEILSAAMQVFAENGVVQSTMSQIAELAGIGKGTIYEYFRSKEDIFAEAYQMVFNETTRNIQEVLASALTPTEKLEMLMRVSVEGLFSDGGKFAGIMMAFWSEGMRQKNEQMMKIINLKGVYDEYRTVIASILQEGIEKGEFKPMDTFITASVLIGAMDGILIQCVMDPNIFSPQKAVAFLHQIFINGIVS